MKQWFPASMTTSTASPIVPSPASTVTAQRFGIMTEVSRVDEDLLGFEMGQTKCSSASGPCTKPFQYGTVSWATAAGGSTTTGTLSAATRVRWWGADRYETAAKVAENAYPGTGVPAASSPPATPSRTR